MSERPGPAGTERPTSYGLLLAGTAVVWMVAMLWSARATITGRADAEMEVTSTAYALPGAVSAALVAGAGAGLAVLALISRRRLPGTGLRFAAATGTGLVVGLLGALSIITINTEGWVYAVVGGTLAAAATIGGALAGFRLPRVIAAACWAAVAVFVVGFLLSYFQSPVLDLFGLGTSRSSQTSATQWFAFCQSLLSGLVAGILSYRVLRRARTRSQGSDVAWPFYALAGAGPGLLLVIAEVLTRTAGARVLDLAGRISELETVVQQMLSTSRFNSALIVLFAGAITAVIAVGRTLKPAPDGESAPAEVIDETGARAQITSSSSETANHSSS